MNIDDVMAGRVPVEIARDPMALARLWSQVRETDHRLKADPGAEAEWMASVEDNAYEGNGRPSGSFNAKMMTVQEQAKEMLSKISSGEFNGMSDLDYKAYRQHLLALEKEAMDRSVMEQVAKNGFARERPPMGSVLSELDNSLAQDES